MLNPIVINIEALDSLTEPEAIDNFNKFGNPDGPQYVQLFAVDSFIKDQDASRINGRHGGGWGRCRKGHKPRGERYRRAMGRSNTTRGWSGSLGLILFLVERQMGNRQ